MNPTMVIRDESQNVTSALELISSLEPGECRILRDFTWDDYEMLLEVLGEGYATRVAYTEGTLEVMAPLYRHEKYKETLLQMVRELTRALGLKLESGGSTTLKRRDLQRGAEPDTCFYIQHASQMIGKDVVDLAADPPPDIVFEVDVTSKSQSKLVSYARFGVPEFWRYDGEKFRVYELSDENYAERDTSITFPFLTTSDLERFLEQSRTDGQDAALDSIREWVKKQHAS